MRPRSINFFEIFGFAAAGLGILRVLVAIIQMAGTRGLSASHWFYQIFMLLLFAGVALTVFMAARKRHDVMRAGFYVVAVMTVLALMRGFADGAVWVGSLGVLFDIIDLLVFGALLAAGIALWQREAAEHMVPGGIKTPGAPGGWGQPGAGYPPQGGYPPAVGGQPQPAWPDATSQGVGYPPQQGANPAQPGQQPPYQPPHNP